VIANYTREALKAVLLAYRKQMSRAARRRPHRPTRWLYPWATEKHYAAAIRAWLRPMVDYVHEYLAANQEAILRGDSAALVRNDALPGGTYRRMVQSLNGWASTYIPPLEPDGSGKSPPIIVMGLGKIADTMNDFNEGQYEKAAKAELGVHFPVYEDWWPETKKAWAEQNYNLIRKMSNEYITQVNTLAEQAVVNGWSVKQLQEAILKADQTIKGSRANLIARDQIGKLNGMSTQARMESLGLEYYTWSTSSDERVRGNPAGHYPYARPSHYLMEGLLCRWDDPKVYSDDQGKTWQPRPAGAVLMHPGYDIQCRCTALMWWDEIEQEVDRQIDQQEGVVSPEEEKRSEPHPEPKEHALIKRMVHDKVKSEQEAVMLGRLVLKLVKDEKKEVLDVLKQFRNFGSTDEHTWSKGSSHVGKERIRSAQDYFPTEWLKKSMEEAKVNGFQVKSSNRLSSRGYYSRKEVWDSDLKEYIPRISLNCLTSNIVHELAHRMEHMFPEIVRLEKEFYDRRTQGEIAEKLRVLTGRKEYRPDEKAKKDKFNNPYMGKDYGGLVYEILSMGLEKIYYGLYDDKEDEDYDAFIAGLLAGL